MMFLKAIKLWCNSVGLMKSISKAFLLALAVLTFTFATGCSGMSERSDIDEKPWNAPKSWESGIPQGMMQGR
jgi:hypothetical protein